jgi:NagD protein
MFPTHFFSGYIFDLDGTVYLGDALLPQAGETITALRARGCRTVFVSNNPTHTRQSYAAKLTRLGLPTPVDDILNSSGVMVDFLQYRMPGAKLFVAGERPLVDDLTHAGFSLSENPAEIQAVIASFDRTFDYRKLQIAFDAIRLGARFFATNPDKYCPVPLSESRPTGGEPDCAAIVAALEACTGVKVEAVVGKPSPVMIEAALRLVGLPASECVMIGDRLETDVKMGLDAGMAGALTLTGATPETALAGSDIHPTYVLRHLGDLIPIGPQG